MKQVTIEQVIANPALVSLPSVALDVLALTRRPGVKLSDIAAVVQNDQALTAKILKTVNSSFYGLPRPCPTITRALTYLGLSAVKSLVLGFSLIDTARQSDGLDMISHWRRGIYSAAAFSGRSAMQKKHLPPR
jgi:two-component system cell cycle response regulator